MLGRVDPEPVNAVLAHKLLDPRLVRADDLGELGVDVHEREGRVPQPAELGRGRVRVVNRAVGVVVVWVREQVVVLLEEVVSDVEICRVGVDGDVVDDYRDERRNAKMSASGNRSEDGGRDDAPMSTMMYIPRLWTSDTRYLRSSADPNRGLSSVGFVTQ